MNATTGAIVAERRYSAFGRVTFDSNPTFQPFGFAGGLYDPDTSLVRLGARDYDPALGRWATKDAALFAGGTNVYLYAHADSVNRIDLNGQFLDSVSSSCGKAPALCAEIFGAGAAGATATGAGAGTGLGPAAAGCLIGAGTALATTSGTDEVPTPPDNDPDGKCYKKYLEQTAYCGQQYTDDTLYETCMKNAWGNYIRCLNGQDPKPLVPRH